MPGDDRSLRRRSVLGGGAAALVAAALPLPAGAGAHSNSKNEFATDIRLPGLLHAAIARPPLPGWRLAAVDAAAALRLDRVVGVIRLAPASGHGIDRLGGAAVLARDTWTALRGRDALRPAWEARAATGGNRDDLFFVPETAEPLMEPPSATVQVSDGHCTVWTCTSRPDTLRRTLAACLALAPEVVTLHPTPSACGRRATNPAYAVEAALLSRAVRGAPVSLTWTVADDLPFRGRSASA